MNYCLFVVIILLNNIKLCYEFIRYGYSSKGTKNNLISVPFTNEIAYSAGPMIILYNIEKRRQRIYREHVSLVRW